MPAARTPHVPCLVGDRTHAAFDGCCAAAAERRGRAGLGPVCAALHQTTGHHGARLFPALLDYLQVPFEDRSMLDKLHRLEKRGYLQQVDE
jgi:hypothetical protein